MYFGCTVCLGWKKRAGVIRLQKLNFLTVLLCMGAILGCWLDIVNIIDIVKSLIRRGDSTVEVMDKEEFLESPNLL